MPSFQTLKIACFAWFDGAPGSDPVVHARIKWTQTPQRLPVKLNIPGQTKQQTLLLNTSSFSHNARFETLTTHFNLWKWHISYEIRMPNRPIPWCTLELNGLRPPISDRWKWTFHVKMSNKRRFSALFGQQNCRVTPYRLENLSLSPHTFETRSSRKIA